MLVLPGPQWQGFRSLSHFRSFAKEDASRVNCCCECLVRGNLGHDGICEDVRDPVTRRVCKPEIRDLDTNRHGRPISTQI